MRETLAINVAPAFNLLMRTRSHRTSVECTGFVVVASWIAGTTKTIRTRVIQRTQRAVFAGRAEREVLRNAQTSAAYQRTDTIRTLPDLVVRTVNVICTIPIDTNANTLIADLVGVALTVESTPLAASRLTVVRRKTICIARTASHAPPCFANCAQGIAVGQTLTIIHAGRTNLVTTNLPDESARSNIRQPTVH